MSGLLLSLAVSLGLTLLVELLFARLSGLRRTDLLLVALVNIVTNPAVVLAYHISLRYTLWSATAVKALLETAAVVAEGLYYRRYASDVKRPFLFSLAANALSFTTGLIINKLLYV